MSWIDKPLTTWLQLQNGHKIYLLPKKVMVIKLYLKMPVVWKLLVFLNSISFFKEMQRVAAPLKVPVLQCPVVWQKTLEVSGGKGGISPLKKHFLFLWPLFCSVRDVGLFYAYIASMLNCCDLYTNHIQLWAFSSQQLRFSKPLSTTLYLIHQSSELRIHIPVNWKICWKRVRQEFALSTPQVPAPLAVILPLPLLTSIKRSTSHP